MMKFNDYCNKVGLTVNTMLTPKISDGYGATRVSSSRHRISTEFVVIHTTSSTAPAVNEALNLKNNEGGGQSFHAVADKNGVYECVTFSNVAHHAGDKNANCRSLGFELCDTEQDKGYPNYIKYIAYAMAQEGITPSHSTVKFHNEIVSTGCATYLRNKGKQAIINDLNYYIAIAKGGSPSKPSAPKPSSPKPSKLNNNGDIGKILALTKNTVSVYGYNDGKYKGVVEPMYFEGKLTYPILEVAKNGDIVIYSDTYGKVRVNKNDVGSIYRAKGVQLKGASTPVYDYNNGTLKGELTPDVFGGLDYAVLEVSNNGDLIIQTESYGKVRINNRDIYNIYG